MKWWDQLNMKKKASAVYLKFGTRDYFSLKLLRNIREGKVRAFLYFRLSRRWQWRVLSAMMSTSRSLLTFRRNILPPFQGRSGSKVVSRDCCFSFLALSLFRRSLFLPFLTNSMEQSLFWETCIRSASQEIFCPVRNAKVHYRVHNNLSLVSVPIQTNPFHTLPPGLFQIRCDTYPPFCTWVFRTVQIFRLKFSAHLYVLLATPNASLSILSQ
jgi:hypothetical protein